MAETDEQRSVSRAGPILGDAVAVVASTIVALSILRLLHEAWQPGYALACGLFAGALLRRLVTPTIGAFPTFLRRPLDAGVMLLGTLLASWATLLRYPVTYWVLNWRGAILLPLAAGLLGVVVATLAYTHARIQREMAEKRRMEEELRVAGRIQRSLLERRLPSRDWIEVSARNVPSLATGGDYYEVVDGGNDSLVVAIGDVSGKGVPAALLMSTLQSAFLATLATGSELDAICSHLNDLLFERTEPRHYATFFVARLRADGGLDYVNAGHVPPVLLTGDGRRLLQGGGLPLGMFRGRGYSRQRVSIAPGDLLVCTTDGVIEATDATDRHLGLGGLADVIDAARDAGDDAARVVDVVFDAVRRHRAGDQDPDDDITVVVVRRPRRPAG